MQGQLLEKSEGSFDHLELGINVGQIMSQFMHLMDIEIVQVMTKGIHDSYTKIHQLFASK